MPDPQNRFGNALTIINNTRQLSPKARQILQEGSARGSGGVQTFFEDTYFRNEYSKLPQEEAESVSDDLHDDLHNVLEILKPLIELLEESRIQGTYPQYTRALGLVVFEAYKKLESWRCFEGWGTPIEVYNASIFSSLSTQVPFPVLPMVQTDAAMRQCSDLLASIELNARSGTLSFGDRTGLYRATNRDLRICIVGGNASPRQRMLSQERIQDKPIYLSGLQFEQFEDNLVKTYNFVFIERMLSESNHNSYRANFQEMIMLVSGLLDDVLSYSRRVKGEISSGQSLAQSIRAVMSQKTPRP